MKPKKLNKPDYVDIFGDEYVSKFLYIPKKPAKPESIKVSHKLTPEQIRFGQLMSDPKITEVSNKLMETLKVRDEKNKTIKT